MRSVMSTQTERLTCTSPSAPRSGLIHRLIQSGRPSFRRMSISSPDSSSPARNLWKASAYRGFPAGGGVAQPAAHDVLTGGAGEVVLEVLLNLPPRPEGEGADACVHAGELGDGGEGHAEGRGQMAHQVLEELLARAAGGPLDDGT